ncbi:site-specific DNA-methyltransferase [Kushneria aurantia]|uniref:site-specific DNA-methyltransferase (adenine-specific) n=1 Tax=Kushneria aurantia TaxID=504092 RepID=A0ABV6G036_9GAMM|nr:site-specific DNA-methyltransferase [Kushneria aurantia]
MAVATADDRKQRFIDLLHELFQLDKPELDFGLYRIMHAKSDQLSRFIREDLAQSIEEAFAEQGEQQLTAMRQDIEEKRRQAEELGAPDPDSAPAVKQALAAYDVAKQEQNASADIYDHLYRFFSRYYDKGDFMSRRHHVAENDSRAAPYAVPYDGREVYLHWANKDQYYVKSSETLANFTFNLNEALKQLHGSAAQGGLSFNSVDAALKVHCRVVDADEGEHNDVKESTERYFIIHHDEPVRLEGADLVLQFEYRPDPEKTGQSGTWQKKRLEEAEEVIMAGLRITDGVAAYRDGFATPAPTDKQKSRTLLGKYLQQYTARNTMDYFIHKDLSGFLSRELDFYIKNEILRLDDIDNANVHVVEQQLKKIQTLRKVAKKIIIFLAQLESFQKKLWLKKRFVVESDYCITLDHFFGQGKLLEKIFSNNEQQKLWEKVFCLDLSELNRDLLDMKLSELMSLDKYRYLMLDTKVLSEELKHEVISCLERLDGRCGSVAFNADNNDALRFFKNKIKDVDCVYIDPPYNTGGDEFLFKDSYKHSSWLSMLSQKFGDLKEVVFNGATFFVSIDDNESARAKVYLDSVFSENNFISQIVVQSNKRGQTYQKIAKTHEYILSYGFSEFSSIREVEKEEDQSSLLDEIGAYELWELRNRNPKFGRHNRPNLYYPIYVKKGEIDKHGYAEVTLADEGAGCVAVYPKNSKGEDSCWRWGKDKAKSAINAGGKVVLLAKEKRSGGWNIYEKARKGTKKAKSIWLDKSFINESGTVENGHLGFAEFGYPKPISLVKNVLKVGAPRDGHVLDYFAGTGTTAHAAISLNREDSGERKYTLVEAGRYFDTVLKPKLMKAVYSGEWQNGVPKISEGGSVSGVSHAFKYLRLEAYDDTLNNLELDDNPRRDALMAQNPELRRDYTLKYLLDVETRGSASLLNTEGFRDPEGYTLKVKQPGSDETRETAVDLVETFNWLIGLHVTHLDKPRTYVARFEREEDPELPEDQNTRLKAASLRENEDGAYWIRQVEGHVRRIPGSDEDLAKVLVVWRKLTDDPEKDAAVLEALLARVKIGTTDSEFDAIYINGPHGLNLTGSARSRVHSLEETFHARMWEDCDDDL